MAIKVTAKEFPKEIEARFKGISRDIRQGMINGAEEGARILKVRTPKMTGTTANQWEVKKGRGRRPVSIVNNAPHIGVLELGARPHPVSFEGRIAIARWARLKFGVSPGEAQGIAEAIAHKIAAHGQKPTYFVRDSLDDLSAAMGRGVQKAIYEHAKKKASK